MAFLSREALLTMGFKSLGEDVLISDKASIYNAGQIELGSHIRIDDFCILSAGEGGIFIGNYVHLACYVSMIGAGRMEVQDFANIAARTSILSATDDFSGAHLIGPTVPDACRQVTAASVTIGRNVILGAGCVVLPGASIVAGTAVGAMSLVSSPITEPGIYVGIPAKKKKERATRIFELARQLMAQKKEQA